MAILTNSGRISVAESIALRPIHLAWGSGSEEWDSSPEPESIDDVALTNEIGRRKASVVRYCEPDPAGEIIVPTGRFTESIEPTKYLFLRFNFDYFDAPSATIREFAVFVGTKTDPSLPAGQMYFEPADVVEAGTLLVTERVKKIDRDASVRPSFEFVIEF